MLRIVTKSVALVMVAAAGSIGIWISLYPAPSDAKSLQYFLWKRGYFQISLADASGAMVGDPDRDSLIIGKTKPELEKRFGRLLGTGEVMPYFRRAYLSSGDWRHKQAAFIKDSAWMILFEHGKAEELVLLKG